MLLLMAFMCLRVCRYLLSSQTHARLDARRRRLMTDDSHCALRKISFVPTTRSAKTQQLGSSNDDECVNINKTSLN